MSFYPCRGGGNKKESLTIRDIFITISLEPRGDGAYGIGLDNKFTVDVSNFKTMTVGTVSINQYNTYNAGSATYGLDGANFKSLTSGSVIDVSNANTIVIKPVPTGYGNASDNRGGNVHIAELIFE